MGIIEIRAATIDDATELKRCMTDAYSAYESRMGNSTLPPMETDYAEEIASFPTWVATLDGKIVGGLTMIFAEDHASIANIAVRPGAQGHGLGRRLMEFADAKAREKGLCETRLATHVLLSENVSLYSHLGWSEYDRDETRVFMKKSTR